MDVLYLLIGVGIGGLAVWCFVRVRAGTAVVVDADDTNGGNGEITSDGVTDPATYSTDDFAIVSVCREKSRGWR